MSSCAVATTWYFLWQQIKWQSIVKYLGSAVDVIRIFLLTGRQRDVGDVLHWVGQGQKHLALLNKQDEGKEKS